MNIIGQIDYQCLKQFEKEIGGNVKVGGYGMDKLCQIEDGFCYQIKLQKDDINRVFLLGETTFTSLTPDKNYRLSDIIDDVKNLNRVKYWIDYKLDLRISKEWSPIFVCPDINSGPIVTIDGNHRLMAHFHEHNSIEGLFGYIFVHPNIQQWDFIPHEARK